MGGFLARRFLQAVSVVFSVTTLTFVLIHMAPGDPIMVALQSPNITEPVRAQWRASFGLDRPLGEQYLRWMASIARGDLGFSFSLRRPVHDVFADALPRTLVLTGLALVLAFAIGIIVGVLQAERPGGSRDRGLGRVLLVLYSVPDFWLALLALVLFAYRFPVLPAGGMVDPVMHDYLTFSGRVADRLRHLVLPVATLALLTAAGIARYQRAALLDVVHADWMRTAVAKGLSWRVALRRHALRNALLPVITLASLSLPALAAGAVFVERVFSWPGMGNVTVTAIAARDSPLVTAGVLLISTVVAVGSLMADVGVALADPRIRVAS